MVGFVDLICSYGPQLKQVYLDSSLPTDSLKKITATCRYARVNFLNEGETGAPPYGKFSALGSNLDTLVIRTSSEETKFNAEDMADTIRECDSIRDLQARITPAPFSARVVSTLFPRRMRKLESVTLNCLHRHNTLRDTSLSQISSVTGALKLLTIQFCGPASIASIRAIIGSNPNLRYIRVDEREIAQNAVVASTIQPHQDVIEYLELPNKCKKLESFNIGFPRKLPVEFHQGIKDTCPSFWIMKMSLWIQFSNGWFHNYNNLRRVEFEPEVFYAP